MTEKKCKKNLSERKVRITRILIDGAITFGAFGICTALCFLLDYFKVNNLNFLIIYVLGVLVAAVFTKGYIYSSVLSIVSVFWYNFFFTIPRYTFHFSDKMYLITFILMFAVSIIISTVTFKLKKRMVQINALNMDRAKLKNDAEKEQLKATLLRSISHDLRTPLTTIKSGAEMVRSNHSLDNDVKEKILGDIIAKADWMLRLVENLLSLSRIDSDNLTVKKSPEAIEEILPQAVRTVQGLLGNRQIRYKVPSDLMIVPMDATLIIQTIGNIINNATKHTTDNGNIEITVFNSGKNVVFRIANDGEPIRDEDLPHIFEMYYTVGDSNREQGVGLGLAICKLIISAHGGQISARNTSEGLVVFEFTLPMEDKTWLRY